MPSTPNNKKTKPIDKEQMIRDYLLRLIAEDNKRLSGIFNGLDFDERCRFDGFKEILCDFVGGNMYSYPYRAYIDPIYEDINTLHNSYSPYQYFDIDTLFAYHTYLRNIINEIDGIKRQARVRVADARMCSRGIDNASSKLVGHSMKGLDCGYYDPVHPVKTYKVDGKYSPRKPLTEKKFDEKYCGYNYHGALFEYLEAKHPSKPQQEVPKNQGYEQTTINFNNPQGNELDEDNETMDYFRSKMEYEETYDTMDYKVDGITIKLNILEQELFLDREYLPITSIVASNKYGRLYTMRDANGDVYVGPIYDLDHQYVDDSDGETFIPTKEFKDLINTFSKKKKKSTSKKNTKAVKTVKEGPQELTLFSNDDYMGND